MEFSHKPVLLNEVLEGLNIKEDGVYVDCTLGGAGHSKEIIKRLNENGMLIGIDQDVDALKAAEKNLSQYKNYKLVHDNFSNIDSILRDLNIDKADGILMDLGVSSYQLDNKERGFSYMQDAPLDMRMDRDNPLSAFQVINYYDEASLFRVIKDYGEERFAKNISRNITEIRKTKDITSTLELVDIIARSIPAKFRYNGGHPAKRTFQAIRIEVNGELKIIEKSIEDSVHNLKSGGRLCIITFHSLEDRQVKNKFKSLQDPCTCPKEFPICICGKKPEIKIITKKPIIPTEEEITENKRSKSSKLRICEKI
jgi:16S rRNA (cytosine1402-N4)-methyltransferase